VVKFGSHFRRPFLYEVFSIILLPLSMLDAT
jgi:hypothetical protein